MAVRFCSHCGTAFAAEARFCAQCGERRPGAGGSPWRFSPARFPVLFVLATVLLFGATAVVVGRLNPKEPPKIVARDAGPSAPQLPGDHPPVEMPADVKAAIADLQKTAAEKLSDADAWRHLANVLYRASQVDRSYLAEAERAFRHLLTLAPEDLEALRSLGNIAFDRDEHDQAIDFYQSYLKQKPDDLSVQTDLGTMYLSKGDLARAVRTYDAVLKVDPNFFQAQFNLAIAYRSAGQTDAAIGALQRAKEMAPDEASKAQVDMLIARVQGGPAAPPAPANAAPAETGSFRDNVEAIFRQNQIMASKVQRFDWQSDTQAKLYLSDFPMDQMPEGMRSMFLERMRNRLRQQKEAFDVAGPINIELVDFASGKTMDTLTE